MIEHAPRRADDDMSARFERVDLGTVSDSAVDCHRTKAFISAQALRFLPDLFGEFPCWDEDQRLTVGPRRVESFQHGQDERARLAAARARLDHHVAFGKQIRNGARLDGHQRFPAPARGSLA